MGKTTGIEADDHGLEYSKELTYKGILLLANRAAVRAGDGPAMVKFWKFQMPGFWNEHHPKYFILGHQFLVGKYVK